MSAALAALLGRKDRLFAIALDDLEKATGQQGIDAKLVGDILHRGHGAVKSLGISGNEVTARELYHILRLNDDLLDESTDFVGFVVDGQCISLNRQDLLSDNEHGVTFEQRSMDHLHKSLTAEVVDRYKRAAPGAEHMNRIFQDILPSRKEKKR